MFRGVFPAIITPFKDDGSLDEDGLRRNVEILSKTGISGIVPCGTTGESATLSHEEHKRVVEIVIDCSEVPVVAGTGSNNTSEAIDLTRHAADAGADAALLITPYYNRPNERGLVEHFKKVAESAEIPIVLYNVPKRTGVDLRPEIVARLALLQLIFVLEQLVCHLLQIH